MQLDQTADLIEKLGVPIVGLLLIGRFTEGGGVSTPSLFFLFIHT